MLVGLLHTSSLFRPGDMRGFKSPLAERMTDRPALGPHFGFFLALDCHIFDDSILDPSCFNFVSTLIFCSCFGLKIDIE